MSDPTEVDRRTGAADGLAEELSARGYSCQRIEAHRSAMSICSVDHRIVVWCDDVEYQWKHPQREEWIKRPLDTDIETIADEVERAYWQVPGAGVRS